MSLTRNGETEWRSVSIMNCAESQLGGERQLNSEVIMSARQERCAWVVLGMASLVFAQPALAAPSVETRPSAPSAAEYERMEHMMDLHRASRWLITPLLDMEAAPTHGGAFVGDRDGRRFGVFAPRATHGGAFVGDRDVPRARIKPLRSSALAQHSGPLVAALGPGSWQD